MNSRVILEDQRSRPGFRAAVSLHSHTLHSCESLDFINRYARRIPLIRWALDRGEERYRQAHGKPLDLTRAWWTPPVTAHAAWQIESEHIEKRFGLRAFVSITDHDEIEGPMNLQVLEECAGVPVSTEWTVPWSNTFFHLGIHNLNPEGARAMMAELRAFTANSAPAKLPDLLEALAADPEVLIVFNHPCWDESEIGKPAHMEAALLLMSLMGGFVHAMELNGLRPWTENQSVMEFASACGKPVISGGDRHALEPNTILNLTDCPSFAEFVREIRRGGTSNVLVTARYHEPFTLRILESIDQILADHESHGLGWKRWSDRVFYRCEDGVVRSLSESWGRREPAAVRLFVGGVRMLRRPPLRNAFGAAFRGRNEAAL